MNSMKRICILYYNAGGGHRAAATALYNELKTYPQIKVELVNFIEEYHVAGFEHASQSYKFSLKYLAAVNGLLVKASNQKSVLEMILKTYANAAKGHYEQFLQDHPADVYVSTCYYENVMFDYIKAQQPNVKTVMVVTDLAYPLRIWFDEQRDLIIVPTKEIYTNAKKYFKDYHSKVRIMGLPISTQFFRKTAAKNLKKTLKLPDLPTILISGGGEGMSNTPQIVKALDKLLSGVNLCVICGKDEQQRKQLGKSKYRNNTCILGWTDKFADYLLASEVIITKAGATTVWEAMTAKKKTIISTFIKGQEEGNMEFAQKYYQARFCSAPREIAKTTAELLKQDIVIKDHPYMDNWTAKIAKLLTR
jgi:UDP-N-acetylglucosamine:LPS N-acetylglucosamine transferase